MEYVGNSAHDSNSTQALSGAECFFFFYHLQGHHQPQRVEENIRKCICGPHPSELTVSIGVSLDMPSSIQSISHQVREASRTIANLKASAATGH